MGKLNLERFYPRGKHNKLMIEVVLHYEEDEGFTDLYENIGTLQYGQFDEDYVNNVLKPLHELGVETEEDLDNFLEYIGTHYDISLDSLRWVG